MIGENFFDQLVDAKDELSNILDAHLTNETLCVLLLKDTINEMIDLEDEMTHIIETVKLMADQLQKKLISYEEYRYQLSSFNNQQQLAILLSKYDSLKRKRDKIMKHVGCPL